MGHGRDIQNVSKMPARREAEGRTDRRYVFDQGLLKTYLSQFPYSAVPDIFQDDATCLFEDGSV